jgi:hypothetical protein
MSESVTLCPPDRFLPHWQQITEGWQAFFDNKDAADNPYPLMTPQRAAWRWGYFEAMDYGQ